MQDKHNLVKKKSFFRKIPKNCDTFRGAARVPGDLLVITGPCQIVFNRKTGNWFYYEILKDKETKVIKSAAKNRKEPPQE